jgi:hypothetical protein
MHIHGNIAQGAKVIHALPAAVPSSSTPTYVSLKDYQHVTAIIAVNNATTVTGSAITLKQATAVAGTSEKTLSFSTVWANTDTAASDALVKTAVSSDTFTTGATNSKKLLYVIEIDASMLDVNNGFDCFRVGTGDAVAATVAVIYILSGARYPQATPPTALTD